jgi:outer membrane protein assembly factor BamB
MTGSGAAKVALVGLVAWLGMYAPAFATRIALTPDTDHPGATIAVKGTHFAANEAVDVYFDSTDELLVAANGRGAFRNRHLPVPSDALPGTHWVTAVGRTSGLAAQAPLTVSTDWAMYNFAADRNSDNPYENVLSPASASGLTTAWSVAINENSYVNSSPTIADGALYVGSSDANLHAFDASTGALLWSAPLHDVVSSSPAVANGVVFATDGNLFAFDASTGSQLWEDDLSATSAYSSPAVANGVVYIGGHGGKVYAFSASTGAQLWSYNTVAPAFSSPAVVNGVVYIGSDYDISGPTFFALNASTGALLWEAGPDGGGYNMTATPAVVKGVVYVGNWDYSGPDFFAYNASTGALLWEAKLGRVIDSAAAVANGVVYVETDGQYTHTENDIIAMNASTGAVLWSAVVPTSNGGGVIMSAPAVANGVVYVGSGGGVLYAFDANTGAQLWNSGALGEFIFASPAVANGTVYVDTGSNTNAGTLYAFGLNGAKHAVARTQGQAPDVHALRPDWRLKPAD